MMFPVLQTVILFCANFIIWDGKYVPLRKQCYKQIMLCYTNKSAEKSGASADKITEYCIAKYLYDKK